MPTKDLNRYWIYILECKNGKYYTGYTNDLARRYLLHINGKGAKFTRTYKPVGVAQSWKLTGTKAQAMKVEAFIKQKPRAFKDGLVKNPRALKRALFIKFGYEFKIIKSAFQNL
ncbi:MAG: GIY-YIG nuclease family protein [Spirochaetota bacterium]